VLLGKARESGQSRHFTGPFTGESQTFDAEESFTHRREVSIPITELRIEWTYRLTEHLGLGLGGSTSAWWDVAVPPGIVPTDGGDEVLHEDTIVFVGMLAAFEWRF
jgi:hypothetical protein